MLSPGHALLPLHGARALVRVVASRASDPLHHDQMAPTGLRRPGTDRDPSSVLLSSLELSDAHVYEPELRVLLATASHCVPRRGSSISNTGAWKMLILDPLQVHCSASLQRSWIRCKCVTVVRCLRVTVLQRQVVIQLTDDEKFLWKVSLPPKLRGNQMPSPGPPPRPLIA